MVLNSITHFRGIAILMIVAGHCIPWSGWCLDTFPEKAVANLLIGGSGLFVFISGFLFHRVFYTKYGYIEFLRKKIINVFLPYFVATSVPLAYFIFIIDSDLTNCVSIIGQREDLFQYSKALLWYLGTGSLYVGYWYIPFIMILFICTPLFVLFIKCPAYIRLIIFCCMSVVSCFLHRPIDYYDTLHSVVYFLPFYLLGIISSIHSNSIYTWLRGKEVYLFVLICFLAMAQVLVYDTWGNFRKPALEFNGVDIQFFQKAVMCLFLMVLLFRFEAKRLWLLSFFASASFPIYFVHSIIGRALVNTIKNSQLLSETPGMIVFPPLFCLILLMSVITVFILRRCFGSYSRQVIGG